MIFRYLSLFVGLLLGLGFWIQSLEKDIEQLIVFTNEVESTLSTEDLNALRTLAEELKIEFIQVNALDGTPTEINYTPSIVYQNHKGRSFYYGRYKNTDRLRNFLRTSRLAHQQNAENVKKEVLVWENERASVLAPIKITELAGAVPDKFDQLAFEKLAKAAMVQEMNAFRFVDQFNLSRTTRSFYINFYPYLNEEEILFISAEIFSQYNCVKPIFQEFDVGLVSGPWKEKEELFKIAGQLMEIEIQNQIANSKIGDAFIALKEDIPIRTWEEISLGLPAKKNQNTNIQYNESQTLAKKWMVEMPKDPNEAIVMFSFLSPLDNYVGEVKKMTGTFSLKNTEQLNEIKGDFQVDISDVTMGAEDFDYEVQNKMLKMGLFPQSSFIFEEVISGSGQALKLGSVVDFVVKGQFNLLGLSISLEVPAQLEPFLNENGDIRLLISTTFQLPLFEKFNVEGPDGPSPSKDILQFYMKFNLKPI